MISGRILVRFQSVREALSDPLQKGAGRIPEGKYGGQSLWAVSLEPPPECGFSGTASDEWSPGLSRELSFMCRIPAAVHVGMPESTSLPSSAFPSLLSQRVFPYISAMVNNGSLSYDHERDGRPTELGGCTAIVRNLHYDTFLVIRYVKRHLTVSPCLGATGGMDLSCSHFCDLALIDFFFLF